MFKTQFFNVLSGCRFSETPNVDDQSTSHCKDGDKQAIRIVNEFNTCVKSAIKQFDKDTIVYVESLFDVKRWGLCEGMENV